MLTDLKDIQEKMKEIKTFILDMDGTIYLGNDLFPYTHKFLDKVEDTSRNYYFFTNNSSKDLDAYTTKLGKMGIDITPEQMMVSTDVILEYLQEHHPKAKLYVVGTPALLRAFEKAGWTLDDKDPDVVILGFDTTLTYEKLSKLCTFVRHGKTYYGINPDLNCPVEGGEFIPDCGSIARCVESQYGSLSGIFWETKPSYAGVYCEGNRIKAGTNCDRWGSDVYRYCGSRSFGCCQYPGTKWRNQRRRCTKQ